MKGQLSHLKHKVIMLRKTRLDKEDRMYLEEFKYVCVCVCVCLYRSNISRMRKRDSSVLSEISSDLLYSPNSKR